VSASGIRGARGISRATPFFFFFFFFFFRNNMYHTQQDTHVQGLVSIISHALRTIVNNKTPTNHVARRLDSKRARAKAAPLRVRRRR
jgi:hypothetical protein